LKWRHLASLVWVGARHSQSPVKNPIRAVIGQVCTCYAQESTVFSISLTSHRSLQKNGIHFIVRPCPKREFTARGKRQRTVIPAPLVRSTRRTSPALISSCIASQQVDIRRSPLRMERQSSPELTRMSIRPCVAARLMCASSSCLK